MHNNRAGQDPKIRAPEGDVGGDIVQYLFLVFFSIMEINKIPKLIAHIPTIFSSDNKGNEANVGKNSDIIHAKTHKITGSCSYFAAL